MKITGLEKIEPKEAVHFMAAPDGMKAIFSDPENGQPILEDVISLISIIYQDDKDLAPLIFGITLMEGQMIVAEDVRNFVCYATRLDVQQHMNLIEKKSHLKWLDLKGGPRVS